MFCMKCGTHLPDDAKICFKCGEEVLHSNNEDNAEAQESSLSHISVPQEIDYEEQIRRVDRYGYMQKNPKTKNALLDILKDGESIEYIVTGERKGEAANFSGGAFIITNQRIMYIIRSILCRNEPDLFYPINTEIKQGKYLFIRKYIQLGNDKFFFNFPEAIPTIIDIQSKILGGNNSPDNTRNNYEFICNIGERSCKDKAQLYAGNNNFEIRLKGHTPRQIPIDEIYAARAGKDSTVDILTKYSVISMKVNDKNPIVSTIQKYIKNLKEFNFDNDKEHTDLLPSIIKSDFPYDIDKSNKKIEIIRKYDRLVAPLRFDSFTEYLFFDVETLEKFDEKNFNSQRAALGWFLGGDSLKWGVSGKEYTLKIKLKSGYQCLVEAKDGMINITDIAGIDALK